MGTFKETLGKTSPLVKGFVTLVLIGGIVAGAVVTLGGRPNDDYGVAFSGLELKAASEIVPLLDEQRIPYRLEDGGSTILVPSDRVYDVRLQAAAEGLPKSGTVGFELMDNLKLGATEFERRINYIRAIQGELVRTITQLNQVEQARVHVALPEPSLFVKERQPATAAVFLRLTAGTELTADEVRGIKYLVSSAVEDLSPNDVTVVDTNGRILEAGSGSDQFSSDNPETNLNTQLAFQNRLEQSVQSLLEQVFGPGQVVVRVNADLNFDQKVVERELFEPVGDTEGLVASLKQLDENFAGNNTNGLAPAGSDANIPGYQSSTDAADASSYTRSEVTKEYRLNQTHEQLVVAPGTVNRLTVAVMVNRDLTADEQNSIGEVVAAAIGADAQRADQISVIGMPFDDSLANRIDDLLQEEQTPEPAPQAMAPRALLDPALLPYEVGAGAALLLVVVGLVVLRRRRSRSARNAEPAPVVATNGQRPAAERIRDIMGQPPDGPVAADEHEVDVKRLASQHPETVARVLRTWLDA